MAHIFCKYFLLFSRLSFTLFMVSFAVQKMSSLTRSHLFSFARILTIEDLNILNNSEGKQNIDIP